MILRSTIDVVVLMIRVSQPTCHSFLPIKYPFFSLPDKLPGRRAKFPPPAHGLNRVKYLVLQNILWPGAAVFATTTVVSGLTFRASSAAP